MLNNLIQIILVLYVRIPKNGEEDVEEFWTAENSITFFWSLTSMQN